MVGKARWHYAQTCEVCSRVFEPHYPPKRNGNCMKEKLQAGWLKQALEQVAKEIEESPPWLKAIYAQNDAIEKFQAESMGLTLDEYRKGEWKY